MNLARSSLLSTIFYTAILAVLLSQGGVLQGQSVVYDNSLVGGWWNPVSEFTGEWSSQVLRVANIALLFIVSLLVGRLAIKGVIYLERTYLPCIFFVLLTSVLYSDTHSLAPMLATWSMIAASLTGLRSFVVKRLAIRRIFHTAFYFGLAVFFYPPTIYLTPMMLVLLIFFRLPNIKEWAVGLSIMTLPVALSFFCIWVFGDDVAQKWESFLRTITMNDGSVRALSTLQPWWLYTALGVITIVIFSLSIIRLVTTRKYYRRRSVLGFWYFVIFALWSSAVAFASPVRSIYFLPVVIFPLSIVLTTYFATSQRRFWKNLFIVLFLGAILLVQFWDLLMF